MDRAAEQKPFFIIGAQRSGTTMLRLMLNSHSRMSIPFESGFVTEFYQKVGTYGDLKNKAVVARMLRDIAQHPKVKKGRLIEDPERVARKSIRNYADLVDAIFTEYAEQRGKRRWGDKTPMYVDHIDTLWRIFPGCRIIHLVRDGRDVALSLRGVSWGSGHIPRVAEDWRWKTVIAHKVGSVLGECYLEVRYEDLVANPEHWLRRICGFLGEAFEREMLNYYKNAEAEMPEDSLEWHTNSIRQPDPNIPGSWRQRMSKSDREIFEEIAGDALATFGYEVGNGCPSKLTRLRWIYYNTLRRW